MDISIPMTCTDSQTNGFYAPFFSAEPVRMGGFIGSVSEGGPVNFFNVKMNVHGNGTHTECSGHIYDNGLKVNKILDRIFLRCTLLSVYPTKTDEGDLRIEKNTLVSLLEGQCSESLCLRTMPNDAGKRQRKYSGTNPAYLSKDATEYIVSLGVQHLLIDLPSVDREEDGGRLEAHKSFWAGERSTRCTITEFVHVPDTIADGEYLLNLQLADLELDAVPSRPVLFR